MKTIQKTSFPEFSDGQMDQVTASRNHILMGHDIPSISEKINQGLILPVVNFVKDCDQILLNGFNTVAEKVTQLTGRVGTLETNTTQLRNEVNVLNARRIYRYYFQAGTFRLEAKQARMWQSAITGVTMNDTILFDFFKFHPGEAASHFILTKGFVYTGNNIRLSMVNVADSPVGVNNPQMRVTVLKPDVGFHNDIPSQVVGTLFDENGETIPLELIDVEEIA